RPNHPKPSRPPSPASFPWNRRPRPLLANPSSRPLRPPSAPVAHHRRPKVRGSSADVDAEGLAEGEVLRRYREDDQLLQLLLRRQIAGRLRLGADDLASDFEVAAEQEAGAARRQLDRLAPALDVRLGAVFDEFAHDEAQAL